MSQINDALKRAKQSQTPNPPGGVPPLAPVEHAPRRANWIIPGILALIVLACVFAGPLACDHQSAPTPPSAPTNAPVAVEPPAPVQTPANVPPPPAPAPKVQGIVFDAANPIAIVNGKSVHVGDRIGEFQIKAITQNTVTFKKADGTMMQVRLGK